MTKENAARTVAEYSRSSYITYKIGVLSLTDKLSLPSALLHVRCLQFKGLHAFQAVAFQILLLAQEPSDILLPLVGLWL
jgi:hypothetical protein